MLQRWSEDSAGLLERSQTSATTTVPALVLSLFHPRHAREARPRPIQRLSPKMRRNHAWQSHQLRGVNFTACGHGAAAQVAYASVASPAATD